jgi:hypothetical protein
MKGGTVYSGNYRVRITGFGGDHFHIESIDGSHTTQIGGSSDFTGIAGTGLEFITVHGGTVTGAIIRREIYLKPSIDCSVQIQGIRTGGTSTGANLRILVIEL